MAIDLHAHSTCSDGTDSPAALVEEAARAGLDVVAVTDHDTTAGWREAGDSARRLGVAMVPGVEISCERDGRSVHLLGYLLDPGHPGLVPELEAARASRATRLERMVDLMAADGIPVTYAGVLAQVPPGATPGRPHIADALVAAGVVEHRDAAFRAWLSDDSPYYVRHYAPDPVRAVTLVLAAGGVPVLAHPFTSAPGREVTDRLVDELAAAGLVGVEVDHPDHDRPARARARRLADALRLVATGSSDYHGSGKTTRLGQERTDPRAWAQLEERGQGATVVRG